MLADRQGKVTREEYKTFLLLLAPFAPHMTEEIWERIGQKYSIHQQSWPEFDNKYLEDSEVSIVVQVNGKIRDILVIQKDKLKDSKVVEKMARNLEKIQKVLVGKSVKKVINVPGKIVNFVV